MMMSQNEIQQLISTDEINELLLQLELETSILRMTPGEVSKIPNVEDREKALSKIELLNKLYVLPMYELASRINSNICGDGIEFNGIENYSIRGRMFKIREWLLSKGCKIETIMRVVPKTEEELSTLLKASSMGFNLGFEKNQTLDNDDRIMRAKEFIRLLNEVNMVQQEVPILDIDEKSEAEGYGKGGI